MTYIKLSPAHFDFMASFHQEGFAFASVKALQSLYDPVRDGHAYSVLYFKNLPKNHTMEEFVTKARLVKFMEATFSNEEAMEVEQLLQNKFVRFLVVNDSKKVIIGLTAFVSTEIGHFCPLIGVDEDHRGNGLGK